MTLIHGIAIFFTVLFGETFGCMFGGGGFFIQPALLAIGIPAKMAVANDIAAASFASVGFLLTTRYRSREIKQTAALAAPALVIGAFIGGRTLNIIPGHVVEVMILMICAAGLAYTMTHFRRKKDIPVKVERVPVSHWKIALLAAGLFMGFYDGISGAGGGIITITVLSLIMRKDMKTIISMANWVSGVSLVTAGLTFLHLGLLDFRLLAFMVPAALMAGVSAAWISHILPEKLLRAVYAGVLGCLLVYLAAGMLQTHGIM